MELLPRSGSCFAGDPLEGSRVGLHIHDLAGGAIPFGPLAARGLKLTAIADGPFTVAVVPILVCTHGSPPAGTAGRMRNGAMFRVTYV